MGRSEQSYVVADAPLNEKPRGRRSRLLPAGKRRRQRTKVGGRAVRSSPAMVRPQATPSADALGPCESLLTPPQSRASQTEGCGVQGTEGGSSRLARFVSEDEACLERRTPVRPIPSVYYRRTISYPTGTDSQILSSRSPWPTRRDLGTEEYGLSQSRACAHDQSHYRRSARLIKGEEEQTTGSDRVPPPVPPRASK